MLMLVSLHSEKANVLYSGCAGAHTFPSIGSTHATA